MKFPVKFCTCTCRISSILDSDDAGEIFVGALLSFYFLFN